MTVRLGVRVGFGMVRGVEFEMAVARFGVTVLGSGITVFAQDCRGGGTTVAVGGHSKLFTQGQLHQYHANVLLASPFSSF